LFLLQIATSDDPKVLGIVVMLVQHSMSVMSDSNK